MVKGELVSSFNGVEVFDDRGIKHDVLCLDTGVRLGIYGKTFIYIEAGFDTFEMLLDDARDDDNFYDSRENNVIDGYAGLGAGIDTKSVRIEGFVKAARLMRYLGYSHC